MPENKFYKVRNLSPAFDGVILEGVLDAGWVDPIAIISPHIVIGDRLFKMPIPHGSLAFKEEYLQETNDPAKEFTTESPFAKFLYEGNYVKGELHIAYAVFENALQVTIFEKKGDTQKTLYSQNFFDNRLLAKEFIQEVLEGNMDPDDLVFNLQETKERETRVST